MVKLGLNSPKVSKNICMVKLKVVNYQGFWTIVYELRTLIEKCAVVFVSFNDKKGAFTHASRYAKILWYAANQITGIKTSVF